MISSPLVDAPNMPEDMLNTFKRALEGAPAAGNEKRRSDFSAAYPIIELHLSRQVAQKTVTDIFNKTYGYKLHAPAFRKMLEDERTRRKANGDIVNCETCGSALSTTNTVAMGKPNNNEEVEE